MGIVCKFGRVRVMFVALSVCAALLLCGCGASSDSSVIRGEGILTVHYLDVGQSDCTFIEFGGRYTAMIDASDSEHEYDVVSYVRELGYDRIDTIVLTHPHYDHIGGADAVIERFDVGEIYMPRSGAEGDAYEELMAAVGKKGLEVREPSGGDTFVLGEAECEFLLPSGVVFTEENDMGAVLSISYGERRFLFMGDCGEQAEKYLIQSGTVLLCDAVKAGHHGADSASSMDFVRSTEAEYVIFSCGEGNMYGHPSPYAVKRWQSIGAECYRTDKDAGIALCTDGEKMHVCRIGGASGEDAAFPYERSTRDADSTPEDARYVLNTHTRIIHSADCMTVSEIPQEYLDYSYADIERAEAEGYRRCLACIE